MTTNVVKMPTNPERWSMDEMLGHASAVADSGNYVRGIVLLLDDDGDEYRVHALKCDLRNSEAVALLAYANQYYLEELRSEAPAD